MAKVSILGNSKSVRDLIQLIERVATTKTNVLITGESGTGKELVARMLHDKGPLKESPFVPVNCGAIPENLIESEMFGHKKGSFTGAVADKVGLFEVASQGTLFLDEVGELPLQMQVKLLRAIQEHSVRRVGDTDDIKVNTRIIAATNRDLEQASAKGTFREDLFYRLNVIQIKTPPLREREGDIRILVQHFLKKFASNLGKKEMTIEPRALSVLERYRWPGNVRELENVIERSVALESSDQLEISSLPPQLVDSALKEAPSQPRPSAASKQNEIDAAFPAAAAETRVKIPDSELTLPSIDFSNGKVNLDEVLEEVEKAYLMGALAYTGGVKKKAADLLGITFRSIRYRLKKQGIDSKDE